MRELLAGVLQRFILGSLLFNIFLCDLFMRIEDNFFTNYTSDTTLYIVRDNNEEVFNELTNITQKLFTFLPDNQIKTNHSKWHLLLSTSEPSSIQIGGGVINSSKTESC